MEMNLFLKSNTTTAESTEGLGIKQPDGTLSAMRGSETNRAAILRIQYSFVRGFAQMRSATSFCIMMTALSNTSDCSKRRNKISEVI